MSHTGMSASDAAAYFERLGARSHLDAHLDEAIDVLLEDRTRAVRALREANVQVYLACTGAGAGLQNILWSAPGCSDFLAGGEFPYRKELTERFLGLSPDKFCSTETAIDLATEMAANAPIALAQALRAIDGGLDATFEDGLDLERACYETTLATRDRDEGLAAFREKRPPTFKGG